MFQDFSFLIHTHKILCILIHYFHLLHFYPFIYIYIYIYTRTPTYSPSCHPISNTQAKNNVIYLQSFNGNYLPLTLLSHLILTHMSWLQPRKWHLHFISNNNDNYNFDVKVERCRFIGFVNDMIDCGCLEYVFCFKIKEKKKEIFSLYIDFYSIIFLQRFFFFFF